MIYSEIVTYLTQYIRSNDEGVAANIPNFLALALSRISIDVRSALIEKSITLDPTSEQDLPAGFIAVKHTKVDDSIIPWVTPVEFASTTTPSYTIESQQIKVYPSPELSTIKLTYYAINLDDSLAGRLPHLLIHASAAEAALYQGDTETAAAEYELYKSDSSSTNNYETYRTESLSFGGGTGGNSTGPFTYGRHTTGDSVTTAPRDVNVTNESLEVTQGGNWTVTQSGEWTVNIDNIDLTSNITTAPKGTTASGQPTSENTNSEIQSLHVRVTNPSLTVNGTFYPATQPVSLASVPTHTVNVGNWPSTQAVTGTFYPATQPVSIGNTVPIVGNVNIDNWPTTSSDGNVIVTSGNIAITNWPATSTFDGNVTVLGGNVNIDNWPTTNDGNVIVTSGNIAVTSIPAINGNVNIDNLPTIQSVKTEAINDTGNSTTTTLAGGGTFIGTAFDMNSYASWSVNIFSDVASATNGLKIQWSDDATNWDFSDQSTFVASVGNMITFGRKARYVRLNYTNGGSAQASFRVTSYAQPVSVRQTRKFIGNQLSDSDTGQVVVAALQGHTTGGGGGWVDVKVNPSGAIAAAVTGTVGIGGNITVNPGLQVTNTVGTPFYTRGIDTEGSTPTSSPVRIAGVCRTTNAVISTSTVVGNILLDKQGRIVVTKSHCRDLTKWNGIVITSSTAPTTLIAAQGSGVYSDITHLAITNSSATASTVTIGDGTSSFVMNIAAGAGAVQSFPIPIPATAYNTIWTATCGTSVASIQIFVQWINNL